MGDINWKDRCWVTTIFLVKDEKVLLTWNKNLQTWIPVGGHIEPGESPEEAITREVKEEVGCEFSFYPDHKYKGDVKILNPSKVQIDNVPHHNKHINLVFFGKISEWKNAEKTDEDELLKWFSKEDLIKEKMLESVKESALEALKNVR
ncbi:MAG: NUDIX domain-containing protein [Nanoarchaeota archaeon]